jgi:broad specificity phosphatase PhoE
MRITLVRHGETTGESSIRYYGATDAPLSALGETQMRRTGTALAHERFDAVLSSRLQRARRGALLVAQREPLALAAFDEVHFGRWEGWTRAEIMARDADAFRVWERQPETFVYPDGECRQAFHRRVSAGLAELLAAPPGDNLLLVVHRGVIAVILAELLALAPAARRALAIDLGSIHVVTRAAVECGGVAPLRGGRGGGDGAISPPRPAHCSGWEAEVLNRTDHLDGVAAEGARP